MAYSWTYDYAISLPLDVFETMFKCIDILDAQKFLRDVNVSSWSDIKKEDRERMRRGVHKKAYPKTWEQDKPVTMRELESILTGGGK